MNRNETKELRLYKWLSEKSPNLGMREARQFVDEYVDNLNAKSDAEQALIVLLEVLGANESGHGVEKISNDKRPRVRWAMHEAMRHHAGVACSPFSGGFEKFNRDMDEKGKDIAIYNFEEREDKEN